MESVSPVPVQALPSLALNPHAAFDGWISAIAVAISQECIPDFPDTGLGLVATPAEYAIQVADRAALRVLQADDGLDLSPLLPVVQPIWWVRNAPEAPAAVAPGGGAGAVHIYNTTASVRKNYNTAMARLRMALIASLGPAISLIISPASIGHVHLTYAGIILTVTELYGNLTTERLDDLEASKCPSLTASTFHAGTAAMTHAFARSAAIG